MTPTRRQILTLLASPLLAQRPHGKLKITAVELIQLTGHRDAETGVNAQTQINPLYVYDDLRPPEYRDKTPGQKSSPRRGRL